MTPSRLLAVLALALLAVHVGAHALAAAAGLPDPGRFVGRVWQAFGFALGCTVVLALAYQLVRR